MYFRILFLLLAVFFSGILKGQLSSIEKYYGSNYTLCHFLVKDTLWLGSTNCLMKILVTENKVLQIYSIENSPITHSISKIWVDRQNRVCVVYDRNNLAMLSEGNWISWSLGDIIPGAKEQKSEFTDLMISGNGDIYCYEYYYKGIYKYSANGWKKVADLLSPDSQFQKFVLHPGGDVWWMHCTCNTNTESFVMNMDSTDRIIMDFDILDVDFLSDSTMYWVEYDGSIKKRKPNGTVLIVAKLPEFSQTGIGIQVTEDGTFYLITKNELYILKDKIFYKYENMALDELESFVNLMVDDRGEAWMLTSNRILIRYVNEKFEHIKHGIGFRGGIQPNIDKSILWFDSYEYICSYNVKTGEVKHFDMPPDLNFYSFAPSIFPNEMWLSTSKGLIHFDGIKWNIRYDTLKPKTIYDLKYYSPSQLIGMFIDGFENYLSVYDVIKRNWTRLDTKKSPLVISRFYLDKLNRPWSNFFDSIAYYDNDKWNFLTRTNSNMPKQKWIQLAFDSKNKLYAASDTSLYSYDGFNWIKLASSSCSWTSTLFVDSRDWVWLGNSCLVQDYYDGLEWHSISKGIANVPASISGDIGEDSNGDMWAAYNPVIKYKLDLTKTHDPHNALQILKVYPNPASQSVTVECPEDKGKLVIYNLMGKELWSMTLSNRNCNISLDQFKTGLYNVVWKSTSNKMTSKISILK